MRDLLREVFHPDSQLWWWVLGFGVTMWLHAQFFRKDEE
tara:strand:- start:531 stop:647 length:117 start_codon:yes stop_codon:yes gene_type:complete